MMYSYLKDRLPNFAFRSGLAFATLLSCTDLARSQDLVYTPVNPSFGGTPFNSAHLLAIAGFDRPDPPSSQDPFSASGRDSQADAFVRRLESRILSQLSADITDAIFGPDADPSGVFQFDDTTIAFETLLDGAILIEISDNVD